MAWSTLRGGPPPPVRLGSRATAGPDRRDGRASAPDAVRFRTRDAAFREGRPRGRIEAPEVHHSGQGTIAARPRPASRSTCSGSGRVQQRNPAGDEANSPPRRGEDRTCGREPARPPRAWVPTPDGAPQTSQRPATRPWCPLPPPTALAATPARRASPDNPEGVAARALAGGGRGPPRSSSVASGRGRSEGRRGGGSSRGRSRPRREAHPPRTDPPRSPGSGPSRPCPSSGRASTNQSRPSRSPGPCPATPGADPAPRRPRIPSPPAPASSPRTVPSPARDDASTPGETSPSFNTRPVRFDRNAIRGVLCSTFEAAASRAPSIGSRSAEWKACDTTSSWLLIPSLAEGLRHLLHRRGRPRDHDARRPVHRRDRNFLHRRDRRSNLLLARRHRHHRPARRQRFHEPATLRDQTERILERQHSRHRRRHVLPNAVAQNRPRLHSPRPPHLAERPLQRKKARLRVRRPVDQTFAPRGPEHHLQRAASPAVPSGSRRTGPGPCGTWAAFRTSRGPSPRTASPGP